jgi:hypothetical protein
MADKMATSWVQIDDVTIAGIRRRLADCTKLLETYSWVIDSFVLDFFLCSHWPHLPPSWANILKHCSPQTLASLLDPEIPADQKQVWPLSLLAFKKTIHTLALNRKQVSDFKFVKDFLDSTVPNHKICNKKLKTDTRKAEVEDTGAEDEKKAVNIDKTADKFAFYEDMLSIFGSKDTTFKHIFRKHVKPKKQYELARLGKFTRDTLDELGVMSVIDVGAGQGHLARYLTYAHSLQVACVDCNNDFTDSAQKFDAQLENSFRKLERRGEVSLNLPDPPVHVNAHLQPDMDIKAFHSILSEKFQTTNTDLRYCILGLHTCGDLGPVLIKMFAQDSKASVLHSVGCCYMKIEEHFPMSQCVRELKTGWKLTYTNAELACHAVEMYTDRLREGEQDKLKVHCYRAVLEKILVRIDPGLRHSILKTVARAHSLPFKEYALKATSKLSVQIDPQEFDTQQIHKELSAWWEVVTYYTIRLALAPVLETVILLDRCVYLYEQGFRSLLVPLFDPLISPRNQIIFAAKK